MPVCASSPVSLSEGRARGKSPPRIMGSRAGAVKPKPAALRPSAGRSECLGIPSALSTALRRRAGPGGPLPASHAERALVDVEERLLLLALGAVQLAQADDLAQHPEIEAAALGLGVDVADIVRERLLLILQPLDPLDQRAQLLGRNAADVGHLSHPLFSLRAHAWHRDSYRAQSTSGNAKNPALLGEADIVLPLAEAPGPRKEGTQAAIAISREQRIAHRRHLARILDCVGLIVAAKKARPDFRMHDAVERC